jgi:hypothetical protein
MAVPLSLPFFDDFSTSYLYPVNSLWINGGVVINNQYAINPPTKGVATFDGLQFSGAPYSTVTTIVQSATDTLTSRPINLSGLSAASNVVLSFFWETLGSGEQPDPADSIILEFKVQVADPKENPWRQVWSKDSVPSTDASKFFQELIRITQTQYFHAGFQFRFITYGRPSGQYDTWHLDYIYLNQNRDPNRFDELPGATTPSLANPYQQYIRDVAVTNDLQSLLKNYTAMPINQFFATPETPAQELNQLISTQINNLYKNSTQPSYTFSVSNLYTPTGKPEVLRSFYRDPITLMSLERKTIESDPVSKDFLLKLATPSDSLLLQSTFVVTTGDNIFSPPNPTPTIPGVNLTLNDTISSFTSLHNFYAYDDGTAEYGIGVRQRQGRVACRFVLNTPDTLTSIRIYFTRIGVDFTGRNFILMVWKKLDNQNSSILYQKSDSIIYTKQINQFAEYKLDYPVSVSDTFYVGWQQTSNDLLSVGYDVNTNSEQHQFFNTSGNGNWQQGTIDGSTGSIMIRPVFGTNLTTGIEEEEEAMLASKLVVFPNPTTGTVSWKYPGVKSVKVCDLLGRQLLTKTLAQTENQSFQLDNLPNGVYVLHFQVGTRTVVRKVVLRRQQ